MKNYFNPKQEINKKEYKPSDFNINPRQIWKWGEQNLFQFQTTTRKWEKYSLSDIFWLKLVETLTNYGISPQIILNTKTKLINTFPSKTNTGLTNLILKLQKREDVKLIVSLNNKPTIEIITNKTKQNVKEDTTSQLTISLINHLKNIILNIINLKNGKYLMSAFRYGILSEPEIQLLNAIKNRKTNEFILSNKTDKTKYINPSVNDYLNIIMKTNYDNIQYNQGKNQTTKFLKCR